MANYLKILPNWRVVAIFALALLLRWPYPAPEWMHGDERAFILYPLGFWGGDLNPHFFNYPTLQFYLTSILYFLYYVCFSNESLDYFVAYRYFVEAGDLIAISRGTNALLAAATAVVCLRLGRRLYGSTGGTISGLLMAIMPLHTRFSYLAITDISAAFWSTLALLYAIRTVQQPSLVHLAWAGVFVGIAAGCKYPAGLVLIPVLASCWFCGNMRRLTWVPIAASGLVFALTSPYILLDWPTFWQNFSAMGQDHLLGGHALSSTTSWHYLVYPNLRYGVGWVSLLVLVIAPWYPRIGWRNEERILLIGITVFIALLVASDSTFMRYALPLAAPMAVLITRPLVALTRRRGIFGACLLLLIAEPLYASLRFRALLVGDDTRILAQNWLRKNTPDNRYLLQVPTGRAQVPLLNSASVYQRMSPYRNSFGSVHLVRTFSLLGEGPPLPPMYFDRYLDWGWVPTERRHNLYRPPADSSGAVLPTLSYGYHLPSFANQSSVHDSLESLTQPRRSFSVGAPYSATFSAIDEYFVPLGGWDAVRATGPEIDIGALPWTPDGPAPTARQFFVTLAQALTGKEAMEKRDWQAAATICSTLQQVPFNLADALPYSLFSSVYLGHAAAYAALGDLPKTYAAWTTAADHLPNSAEPHFQLGLLAADANDNNRAINHYLTAHQLAPDDTVILYNLGICLMHGGQIKQSIIAFERTNELAPDVENYLQLARAYHSLAQPQQSRAALTAAKNLASQHPQIPQVEHILNTPATTNR